MIAIALSGAVAHAWDCITFCGCDWADGDDLTYHINVNDFTSAQEDAIQDAGNAWDAGPNTNNRGADWNFIRGSDDTSDGTVGNTRNEVYQREDLFFASYGMSGARAITIPTHLGCGRRDSDIVFNSSYSWSSTMPSQQTAGAEPIATIAIHEFGHALGLDHCDETGSNCNSGTTNLAFMHTFGGEADIAATYRINEDDYVGLTNGKPDSSTGKNLMLQRYRVFTANSSLTPQEVWTSQHLVYEGDWEACPGDTLAQGDGPFEIMAIINGTSTQSPTVEWRLSADTNCFSGTEYTLGARTPTISSNTPYAVEPSGGWTIPSGTPAGDYYVCAKIDPDDDIAETTENDNEIRSEMQFTVLTCP